MGKGKSSRGQSQQRLLKKHMIAELGVEKFSDVIKRKLKEKNGKVETNS